MGYRCGKREKSLCVRACVRVRACVCVHVCACVEVMAVVKGGGGGRKTLAMLNRMMEAGDSGIK